MVLKKRLHEMFTKIGNELLEKANLRRNTYFSTIANPDFSCTLYFNSHNRTVYAIPKKMISEYLYILPLLSKHGLGITKKNFIDYIKICISHEVGHAMQDDLEQHAFVLNLLKSKEMLTSIQTIDSLQKLVTHYKKMLVSIEENAWDQAWSLVKEEVNPVYFNLIKDDALSTYKERDYMEEDETFHYIYTTLLK